MALQTNKNFSNYLSFLSQNIVVNHFFPSKTVRFSIKTVNFRRFFSEINADFRSISKYVLDEKREAYGREGRQTPAGTARAENPLVSGHVPIQVSWSRTLDARPPVTEYAVKHIF